MIHYVQYHKTEKMGYRYQHEEGSSLIILTNKPVSELIAATIWLIAGEGKLREYTLVSRFVVDDVGEADHDHFRFFASGKKGMAFVPAIPVNGLLWFRTTYNQTANFSLGLSRIEDADVAAMEKLVQGR